MNRLAFKLVFGLSLSLAARMPAVEKITPVTLPQAAADFAIAPESGTVVVLYSAKAEAVFYPKLASAGTLSDAVSVKVGRKPSSVIFKRFADKNYFIVACEEGNELSVLDADTYKLVKSIPLEMPKPSFLSASMKSDDPLIYYCGVGGFQGSQVGRVDLKNLKDLGSIAKYGFEGTDATVSADGRLLYPRKRNVSPTGLAVYAIDEVEGSTQPRIRELLRKHESSEPYQVDPFGQFIVSGKLIYSPDLRKVVRTLVMSPRLVSSVRPIIVGMEGNVLSVVSRNTFRGLKAMPLPITLPKLVGPQYVEPGKDHLQDRILESAQDKALLVCHGKNVVIVPDTVLKLEAEPFLVVNVEGPKTFHVGRESRAKLVCKEPKATFKLLKVPEGVTLKDGELIWKPNAEQVGSHVASIEIAHGKHTTKLELAWTVRRPSVELDLNVHRMAVDEAGTVAAVMDGETPFGNQQSEARIRLIDLKELKIAASTRIPTGGTELAIDAHHVYVSSANSDVFYALDRKDFSKSRRIFTKGRATQLIPIGDRLLVVVTQRGETMVMRTPSLEEATAEETGVGIHSLVSSRRMGHMPRIPERTRDGWLYDGCVYDSAMKTLKGVVVAQGLWQVTEHGVLQAEWMSRLQGDGFGTNRDFTWLDTWALQVSNSQLMRGSQNLGSLKSRDNSSFTNDAGVLMEDFPAAVWAGVMQEGNHAEGGMRWKAELAFCDLVAASPQLTMTLIDEPIPFGQTLGFAQMKLAARPGRVVAAITNQLFVIPIPELDKNKFPKPIHATALPGIYVVDGKELKVPLANFSDTGDPLEVVLRKEERGVEVAKDKTHLLLNGKEILAFHSEKLIADLGQHAADRVSGDKYATPNERLDAYLKTASVRFEKMVGRKPAGIPMWLPLNISVKNKDLQSLEITFGVFVEVPDGPVRDGARLAFEKNKPKNPPVGRDDQTANLLRQQQELQKRVTDLEGKLEQMNRKLDLLAELLKKGKE